MATYPFASLPENLGAFCLVLRRDLHFNIGPRELIDATRGLEGVDISHEREVRNVLRPILAKTHDDARAFDAAFDRFFLMGATPLASGDETPGRPQSTSEERRESGVSTTKTSPSSNDTVPDVSEGGHGPGAVREVAEDEAGSEIALLRASYSPLDAEGNALVLDPPSRAWLEAAAALARQVRASTSRRWHPALRGPRFDFRRTLRASLHTGGEPVIPKWHAHARRNPRFVLLIDGSRSMGASTDPALQTAIALSASAATTETFAFSTTLRRITRDVRRAAAGERRTLELHQAWGGGTTIGACLHDFILHYAERLIGRDTVVIIASDGLDVGAPDLLRQSMAWLCRHSAAIVWINPLLATPGYEPTSVGMTVARPFVAVLTMVNDPAGLRFLAQRTPRLGSTQR